MNIKRETAVGFLVALGFAKAAEWDQEKLQKLTSQIPEKVAAADVPEGFQTTYAGLREAIANKAEIVVEAAAPKQAELPLEKPTAKPVEKKVAPKPAAKPAAPKKAPVTPAKSAAKPAVAAKPVEKKAVAAKKPAEKAEKKPAAPVKPAAKSALKAAPKSAEDAEKPRVTPARSSKGEEKADVPKLKRTRNGQPRKERDSFGCIVGCMSSKVNAAMSDEWQDENDIQKACGLNLHYTRNRLYLGSQKGVFERRRLFQYRVKAGAKVAAKK